MPTVTNLATQEVKTYTCSAREAVIAAYAQEHKDWSTWEYQERYGHKVEVSARFLLCGDWTVERDD